MFDILAASAPCEISDDISRSEAVGPCVDAMNSDKVKVVLGDVCMQICPC
jgi:hypothetical protein